MRFIKRVSQEQKRIEALIARQEARVRRAFLAFLADARSERTLREIRRLIEAHNIEEALRIVDAHVVRLGNVIPQVFLDASEDEAEALASQIRADLARVAVSFDPTHERAASIMRNARLEFIQQFTRAQRDATRRALVDGLMEGTGSIQMARNFRDSIGLTERQWETVGNYGRLLRTGNREALEREVRDRRFDPTVRRAIEQGEPLSEAQIARMQDRYRARMLQLRAETIARTEATRAVGEAREEAMRQVTEDAGIADELVERTWNATFDERTRDTHRSMDGQTVIGQQTAFTSPSGAQLRFPGDPMAPPGETINCRCVVTTRIVQAAETEFLEAA